MAKSTRFVAARPRRHLAAYCSGVKHLLQQRRQLHLAKDAARS
jgi:hypothetical protein